MSKTKTCPVCGKEIAANAKACPSCGARNKKPVYKKWWFWGLLALVLAAAVSSGGGDSGGGSQQSRPNPAAASPQEAPAEEAEITYAAYTVQRLMGDLDSNALRAKNSYQDQYVELSGRLNVIDNDGKYISIVPSGDDFAILGVHCSIQTDGQLSRVLEMNIGDDITVRGKITDVGEILGYTLDIDDFGE